MSLVITSNEGWGRVVQENTWPLVKTRRSCYHCNGNVQLPSLGFDATLIFRAWHRFWIQTFLCVLWIQREVVFCMSGCHKSWLLNGRCTAHLRVGSDSGGKSFWFTLKTSVASWFIHFKVGIITSKMGIRNLWVLKPSILWCSCRRCSLEGTEGCRLFQFTQRAVANEQTQYLTWNGKAQKGRDDYIS